MNGKGVRANGNKKETKTWRSRDVFKENTFSLQHQSWVWFIQVMWTQASILCTCNCKLDNGSDLSLLIIGGQASVVACVGPCDCGEVQCAPLLLHPHWDITAICKGCQRHRHTSKSESTFSSPVVFNFKDTQFLNRAVEFSHFTVINNLNMICAVNSSQLSQYLNDKYIKPTECREGILLLNQIW